MNTPTKYLICDVCCKVHEDTEAFTICDCGRIAVRMEWATPEQIANYQAERNALRGLVASNYCHISQPYTLREICNEIDTGDYSAELMLQHLLLWVDANKPTNQKP